MQKKNRYNFPPIRNFIGDREASEEEVIAHINKKIQERKAKSKQHNTSQHNQQSKVYAG